MIIVMKNKRGDRLSDSIALRITSNERTFLETVSMATRTTIGETIRLLIDDVMDKTGAEERGECQKI